MPSSFRVNTHDSARSYRRDTSEPEMLLTSMVDMFTILLIFLLVNYSVGGQLMYMIEKIFMPKSISQDQLQLSVELAVAKDSIYLDGSVIMDSLADGIQRRNCSCLCCTNNLKSGQKNLRIWRKRSPYYTFLARQPSRQTRRSLFISLRRCCTQLIARISRIFLWRCTRNSRYLLNWYSRFMRNRN